MSSSLSSLRAAGWAESRDAVQNATAVQRVLVRVMETPSLTRKKEGGLESLPPVVAWLTLERVTQRELHLTRVAEDAGQLAELGGRCQAQVCRVRIEPHRVGDVVGLPAELELL